MPIDKDTNKRLAKNTVLLYFRMFFLMVVSLYTSRIVLNALGVEDFGIYNVVAGLVSMFNLFSSSITIAITRFITFELGKKEHQDLIKVFSSSINVQIGMIVFVVIVAETIGLWFLNTKMVIPSDRLEAANYVYQATILSLVVYLINIPYNAAIIAHERMSAFAYIGIVDAIMKLIIAFMLIFISSDKLIIYGVLTVISSVILRILYFVYCKHSFYECTYHLIYDKEIMKKMFSYAGWTYIGTTGALLRDQGGIILINLFFGPVVNAARGISIQVQNAVNNFSQNFMTAINPQITKSYASGDIVRMKYLISKGTRFGYFLVLLLSLPILINTDYILYLWLKNVPEYTSIFVILSIVFILSESISNPLITAASACGNIRNYQLLVGSIQFANFPLSYILLKFGSPAAYVIVVSVILSQICLLARLYILRGMIQLSSKRFLADSYVPILLVTIISAIGPYFISLLLDKSMIGLIISLFSCLFSTGVSVFFIGLTGNERSYIVKKAIILFNKHF